MSNPFKIGDEVKCIDGDDCSLIRAGQQYVVAGVKDDPEVPEIRLQGITFLYEARRFIHANPKHPFMVGSLR
jgi:hypothetical protein